MPGPVEPKLFASYSHRWLRIRPISRYGVRPIVIPTLFGRHVRWDEKCPPQRPRIEQERTDEEVINWIRFQLSVSGLWRDGRSCQGRANFAAPRTRDPSARFRFAEEGGGITAGARNASNVHL